MAMARKAPSPAISDLDYLLEVDYSQEEQEIFKELEMELEQHIQVNQQGAAAEHGAAVGQNAAAGHSAATASNNGLDPAKPLPALVLTPYERTYSPKPNPILSLDGLACNWKMEKTFVMKRNVTPEGVITYEAILTIGDHRSRGTGATIAEAKEEAAAKCLDVLIPMLPSLFKVQYKPVVKTDPTKDILHVLRQTCIARKWKQPKYSVQPHGELAKDFVCFARIGDLVEYGGATKKRVAFRIAAIKLYVKLRELDKKGEIPAFVLSE